VELPQHARRNRAAWDVAKWVRQRANITITVPTTVFWPPSAPRQGRRRERRGLVAIVETVRGPVDLDDLGRTLMHEHTFIMQPEALQNWGHAFGPSYWDEEERSGR
jgi:hypothetical protein